MFTKSFFNFEIVL
uniref:Uncharacterized protein n=1 Tax=Lepeophtheirus salmonis TaxID=72036 RepID=A0A0K2UD69_LEPSM